MSSGLNKSCLWHRVSHGLHSFSYCLSVRFRCHLLTDCCLNLARRYSIDDLYLSPIRVSKSVGIVVGIPIPIEARPGRRLRPDRVDGQEPARDRIIVALLHVVDAGLGIVDVAGEAGALGRRADRHEAVGFMKLAAAGDEVPLRDAGGLNSASTCASSAARACARFDAPRLRQSLLAP